MTRISVALLLALLPLVAHSESYLMGGPDPVTWLTSSRQASCSSNATTKVTEMLLTGTSGISLTFTIPEEINDQTPVQATIHFELDVTQFSIIDQTVSTLGDFSIPHVNIHSCISSVGACTPFIANTPGLSTHTSAQSKDFSSTTSSQSILTETILVTLPAGSYTIIGHVRFFTANGKYDVAMGQSRTVKLLEKTDNTLLFVLVTCGGFVALIACLALAVYGYTWHKANEAKRLQAELAAKRKAAQGQGKGAEMVLPEGTVVLVDTDVESSTALWEWNASVMADSLILHDNAQRDTFAQFGGIELMTEGDAFLVCFSNPTKAISYCLALQEALMQIKWPAALAGSGNESVSDVPDLFTGLRVRMGAHLGQMDVSSVTMLRQSDLFSKTREVSDFAHGGQVLVSNELFAAVQHDLPSNLDVCAVGNISSLDTAMGKATSCVQLTPGSLEKRAVEFLPVYDLIEGTKPPAGRITAVFTACQDLKKLQQSADKAVVDSTSAHLDSTVVETASSYKGYVSKGEGGKFFIVFQAASDAVAFANALHQALVDVPWRSEVYQVEGLQKRDSCAGGLRICIGMVTGAPTMYQFNKQNGKMDYFGQVVNRAARTMSQACPGETCLEQTSAEAVKDSMPEEDLISKGLYSLKGVEQQLELFRLLPSSLSKRADMFAEYAESNGDLLGILSPISPAALSPTASD